MRVKFLGAIAVALLLILVFAVVAQAAVPQSVIDAIIKDAQDGTIDGNWTAAEIRAALGVHPGQPTSPAVFATSRASSTDYLASLQAPGDQGGAARVHRW